MNESDYKFHIGDRVVIAQDYPDGNDNLVCGVEGTVVGYHGEICDDIWYSVEFDEAFDGGHDCGGTAREGHGWNTGGSYLEFAVQGAEDEISAESCQSVIDFLCT